MREESSSTALVVSALVALVIDQVTSRRERGVTECIRPVARGGSGGSIEPPKNP